MNKHFKQVERIEAMLLQEWRRGRKGVRIDQPRTPARRGRVHAPGAAKPLQQRPPHATGGHVCVRQRAGPPGHDRGTPHVCRPAGAPAAPLEHLGGGLRQRRDLYAM